MELFDVKLKRKKIVLKGRSSDPTTLLPEEAALWNIFRFLKFNGLHFMIFCGEESEMGKKSSLGFHSPVS